MTIHEKTLLLQYFVHRTEILEDEHRQLRTTLRYRKIDSADCLECCISLERLNAFKEFTHDVMQLLRLVEEKEPGY